MGFTGETKTQEATTMAEALNPVLQSFRNLSIHETKVAEAANQFAGFALPLPNSGTGGFK